MDKYEYRVKTEELLEYVNQKQYQKAMEIADTIDWRRVKNASMLNVVSEVYEHCKEFQKSRDILFVAYNRSPESRKIVYRLGTLALKIGDTEEALDCYEEFVKLAPRDPNQYILKYKILSAQRASLEEQIAALEEFKKAEYIEKWAYELAKLYHEAGMTKECLEECDDLILWFSEGKYVYMAMELKMKYKPLTPLQQEKYDQRFGKKPVISAASLPEEYAEDEEEAETEIEASTEGEAEAAEEEPAEEKPVEEELVEIRPAEEETMEETPVEESLEEEVPVGEEETPLLSKEDAQGMIDALLESAVQTEEVPVEEEIKAEPEEPAKERKSAITKIVSGATLEEALASTVAILNKEEKAMAARDEELRLGGQMRIDEILMEWEEKQKANAEAIEKQRQEDEIRLQKEREESQKRIEAERRAAEEAARKAAEEAARKAAEEAARKAAEEEAARKAAEEAARKAAEEEAARKAAEEEAARKAAEEEAARKAAEEEAARIAAEEEAARKAAEEEKLRQAIESLSRPEGEQKTEGEALEGQTKRLPDDIMALVEQLENRVGASKKTPADFDELEEVEELDAFEEEESFDEDFIESILEDGISEMEDDFEEEEVFEEDAFEEEDVSEEDVFEEEEVSEEDAFEEEEVSEEDAFEEDSFGEPAFDEDLEEEDFEEDTFEENIFEEDFEELEIDEADFEEDFEEADFEEVDFEEEDFEEDAFEEDIFEEADFEMESDDEADFEEDDTPLEIEEPSEEEIQKRIKKSKGSGVPFDTGFVVTGRYDLSATSEIGLKAGLTEEQKKLFSYFVPVRGMSEQIVEVLDNDRRARREGTSKTGNILVIGRKGSGKTVLAVDIVKAIQKQRNLKQGKVAIVTGESLNKKELSAIIQKLRGGAIIVEKAGKLNSKTVKELNHLMERKTGEMLFVLEDERKNLERVMKANPEFKKKFTSKLELPIFINDELVTFGQTYAKENGYKLDEMGILALYSRIDIMQREDHAVSVAEVKDIMDEAIAHSQKANVKHLARRVFGKGTDESDRIILQEEDFRV